MESFGKFIILFIQQFAGGPGAPENNLMRFGLAAVFWSVLLVVAWSRQRNQDLPREKLLVWGFGLAVARELIMFGLTVSRMTDSIDSVLEEIYSHPLEHALEMSAVIVVAAAFLRYALGKEKISRRYIQMGLSVTILALLVTFITWPRFYYANPGIHFHETIESRTFHFMGALFIAVAIFILIKKQGWLQYVVSIALGFLIVSQVLPMIGEGDGTGSHAILCPIGNAFHILAIPIFGYVYLKEMSLEKEAAEKELASYRDHLEDLVDERTAMLVAQNAIADSLSQSLDLETILNMALDKVLPVLSMEAGLIFLLDHNRKKLSLESYRGRLSQEDLDLCLVEGCPYERISQEAIEKKQIVFKNQKNTSFFTSTHIRREDIQLLISAPLISKDHIVGALTLGSRNADPLDQENLDLLIAVCNQISIAVENAYLYQESEKWAAELSLLHQASIKLGATLDRKQINEEIAKQSAKLTGCQISGVLYWDSEYGLFEIISNVGMDAEIQAALSRSPKVKDLLDELRTTQKSIVINDLKQDERIPEAWIKELGIRCLLCTPVWGVNEPVEFLFLLDSHEDRIWQPKDVELIESFVSRAAGALENANLHKQLEWAAALEERQRIAAEMHDGLAQTISLLGLEVDHTTDLIPSGTNEEILKSLSDIRETVGQASIEVRKSISSLHNTPQPRKSLQEVLKFLVDQQLTDNSIRFNVNLSFPESLCVQPDCIAQVTPIVQEAIINAKKHSGATQISIQGEQQGQQVSITVEDNGKGFDVDELLEREESHFGIRVMHARAARFGGTLRIVSGPDHGTVITLSWVPNGKSKDRNNLLRESVASPLPAMEGDPYA